MSEPIPESLRRAGITGCTSNLPEGCGIDFAADFVRIFRPEIEERLYGWRKPKPAVTRTVPKGER